MFTRKQLPIATVRVLIAGFVGGLIVGSLLSTQFGGGLSRSQVEKIKLMFPIVPEMRSVSGTVTKIDGTTIRLEIEESSNPFDEWPTSRKVIVTDTTKIIRTSIKDPVELEKEMEVYRKTIADKTKSSLSTAPTLPSPPGLFKEESIQLSDLKEGSLISVDADHNIKSEKQFTAVKIYIDISVSAGMPAPIMPAL